MIRIDRYEKIWNRFMAIFLLTCGLLTGLIGCGQKSTGTEGKDMEIQSENGQVQEADITKLDFTEEVAQIEQGFSYGAFTEESGFDQMISRGGAASDTEVIQYLAANVFAEAENLSFAEKAFGCSTLSTTTSDGNQLFGRNFDWSRCNALVVKNQPKNGYESISTVNTDFIRQGAGFASAFLSGDRMLLAAVYAPLDGMNEKGYAISVNMISDGKSINQNTDKPDLTTTTAVRLLLNRAANVDEALKLLEQYDMHSSMGMMVHFAMTDRSGKSVVVEYIDNQMSVVETPVVTNFYLTPGDSYGIGTEQSMERYNILMEKISGQTLTESGVRDALDRVSKDNFVDSATTEWSIVFNLNAGKAVYYHREDFGRGYEFHLD